MEQYHISDHVYACVSDGHIVFLDTKRDQYLSLTASNSVYFKIKHDEHKIVINNNLWSEDEINEISEIVQELEKNQIITKKSKRSPVNNFIHFNVPEFDLTDAMLSSMSSINAGRVLKFYLSTFQAIYYLKIKGLHKVVEFLRNRPKSSKFKDRDILEKDVYIFRSLRRFAYTSHNHCYFDCAVLMFYLIKCGHDPQWVFSVQVAPFRAHCWVQVNDILVSDSLFSATSFDPIMIV